MLWVIQENLAREVGHKRLLPTIHRRSLPVPLVKVVPFSHQLIPEPQVPAGPVAVSGSTGLSQVALERGCEPGGLLNENFDFSI